MFFSHGVPRTYGAAEGLGRAEIVVATANLLAYVKVQVWNFRLYTEGGDSLFGWA